GVAAVRHRNRHIPQETHIFRAPHGRLPTNQTKSFFAPFRHSLQSRSKFRRTKRGIPGYWSFPIPGAYILTDVAAEQMGSDSRRNLDGNRSALLDSEIGNTEP